MNILQKIVAKKKHEVQTKKALYPEKLLEQSLFFRSKTASLKEYLQRKDRSGIIAEIKRKSPSVPDLHPYLSVEQLSIGYMQAGASALSVLTDREFFGGSSQDLEIARKYNFCPILRKDFILDEYQIVESKSIGADAILLIARLLTPEEIERLSKLASSLGLEVLLEVHSKDELAASLGENIDIVGVNNRDLDTLTTDIERSFELSELIPANFTKISESGLRSEQEILALKKAGFNGFLIGESFLAHAEPHRECARLVNRLMRSCDEI